MLSKKENEGLFVLICNDLGINPNGIDYLADAKLEKVTQLYIGPTALSMENYKSVQSLRGIEQLKNLKYFAIFGTDTSEVEERLKAKIDLKLDADKMNLLNMYKKGKNYNQVVDFSPLQECVNLTEVTLYGQHNVKAVDFGNRPRLKKVDFINCDNLTTVSGLSKPAKSGALSCVRFIGCDNLSSMADEKEFFEIMKSRPDLTCNLPSYYGVSLLARHQEIKNTLLELSPQIKFRDIGYEEGSERDTLSVEQIVSAFSQIDNLSNNLCKTDDTAVQKLSSLYRYFCDTKVNDFQKCSNYNEEEGQFVGGNEDGLQSTSVALLLGQYAGDYGCARTLNLCGRYFGLAMELYAGELTCEKSSVVSRLKFNIDESEKPLAIYFDLLQDLGSKESKYLGINHAQLVGSGNFTPKILNNSDDFLNVDMQDDFKNAGMLTTSAQNKEITAQFQERNASAETQEALYR